MTDAAMNLNGRPVYVVGGARTPQQKAKGAPGPLAEAGLAVRAGRLRRSGDGLRDARPRRGQHRAPHRAAPRPAAAHTGVDGAAQLRLRHAGPRLRGDIVGRAELVLTGGVEAMSRAPVLLNEAMVTWLAQWNAARGVGARARALGKLRPAYLAPVIGLLRGLTDPLVGLIMGQTAENLAYRFLIGREQMDAFALESHRRLAAAQDEGRLGEIEVLYDNAGKVYAQDDGLRRDGAKTKRAN